MKIARQSGKAVLITGAGRRIGAAIARKFHSHGYTVIVHCNKSIQDAQQLAQQLNQQRADSASVLQADLTQEQDITRLANQVCDAFGSLEVIVNNASSFYPTPFGTIKSRHWNDLVDSNLRGAFFLCQALADTLRENHGAIVNLLDIYIDKPQQDYSVYNIAKAGLKAMTRSLAVEMAPHTRVNGVAPGAILWPEGPESDADSPAHQAIIDKIPLGVTGRPEDIAETVFFLAVEASYVTGEVIRVDGGRRLNL